MTAVPFMASGSAARVPADETLPLPVVPYQFIALLGPACRTRPFDQPKSQAWLSARYTPWASAVSMGATRAFVSRCQPPEADQTSPFLPPWPPFHDPPIAKTR